MKTFLNHKFVEYIPDMLEEGILYITIEYKTAVHLCVCGCGNKVITPITPTDWEITFNGKSISLHPSIGNWNFACKTHYWIIRNEIRHSSKWSSKEIESGRKNDESKKKTYFSRRKSDNSS